MISIFSSRLKHSYAPDHHLAPFSAVIRGDQIAERIGAKLNPTTGYEDDICIFVKSFPLEVSKFHKGLYVDIVDGIGLCEKLRDYREVSVITCSHVDYGFLKRILPNNIVLIPQQNCNFERYRRVRKYISCVGIIGTYGAWKYIPVDLEAKLLERDINLWQYSDFTCRQDVLNFYLNIDVQVVWRPYSKKLSNPLKIINAASFGIPTIALQERCFDEFAGCYIPVSTFDELLTKLDMLRESSQMYDDFKYKCIEKAEEYHIDTIAEMYKALDI